MNRKPMAFLAALAFACALAPAGAQTAAAGAAPQSAPAPAAADAGADAMFRGWDADHNGVLSQTEFRRGWESLRARAEAKVEDRLREQFDKVDADHDGAVDAGEYGNLMLVRRAGKSAPALSAFDGNGDRKLDFDEYIALVARLAATLARPAGN
jgi:Ca2+-binding EF-hand superfamily protein